MVESHLSIIKSDIRAPLCLKVGPVLTGGEQCGCSGPRIVGAHPTPRPPPAVVGPTGHADDEGDAEPPPTSSRSRKITSRIHPAAADRIGAASSSVAHADASAIHGGFPLPREALRHNHQVSSSNTPTPLVHCQIAIAL
uniref:Uncharacterized protein n=1 Tax=Oryza barthii TaxID=65489 RepID=A0A0D3G6T5_9ORYZ